MEKTLTLLEIIQTVSPRQARVIDEIMSYDADLDTECLYSYYEQVLTPNRWDMNRMCQEHVERLEWFLEVLKDRKVKKETEEEYSRTAYSRYRKSVAEKNSEIKQ